MNKKAQFELDMETLVAIGLGLACGIISVIVAKGSPVGGLYKIITFLVSSVVGFLMVKFIISR